MKTLRPLVGLALLPATAFAAEWDYAEHGPDHWAELDPEYTVCASGRSQSPVDIAGTVQADLPPIVVEGESSIARGVNNGHTIQFDFTDGARLHLGDESFHLKQVHFHAPSENQVDGRSFPLEAHFVHASEDGELAVLALLFEIGNENRTVGALWSHIRDGEAGGSDLDWSQMLPESWDYYYFSGSLTTPPCSEGVHWMVLKAPATVATSQVEEFAGWIHGHNNRPVQPRNARMILE